MTERDKLLESVASTVADYRAGEIAAPTPQHVDRWVKQFDAVVQLPLLRELDFVLRQTYFTKNRVTSFLRGLLKNEKLVGAEPCAFWKQVKFLRIQGGGNSQREMLSMLDSILLEECGIATAACGTEAKTFIYLDDVIFTGNRALKDLCAWVTSDAPKDATVQVITIAFHRGGQFYAKNKIDEAAATAKKNIKLSWWRCAELEDTKAHINTSDVLRPTSLPADPLVQAYAASLKYKPVLRHAGNRGEHEFFSSDEGRILLEQEMLKAGVNIRQMCPHLNVYQRPLGNMVLQTLGFGSLIVTFRNCPNNAPLALWAGDPWYPLFQRKTN